MQHCFDVELLKKFSFTGISKNRHILPKPAFKKYAEIIRLIYKVIHKADASYTIIKNDAWLQDFFRYAKGRLTKRQFESIDEWIENRHWNLNAIVHKWNVFKVS